MIIYECSCGSKKFERLRYQEVTNTGEVKYECGFINTKGEPEVICSVCGKEAQQK